MQGYTCHFTSHLTQLSLTEQGKHQLDFKKEGKIIKLKNSDKIAIRVESMATKYAYMVFPPSKYARFAIFSKDKSSYTLALYTIHGFPKSPS
jgi:hypothetical protein